MTRAKFLKILEHRYEYFVNNAYRYCGDSAEDAVQTAILDILDRRLYNKCQHTNFVGWVQQALNYRTRSYGRAARLQAERQVELEAIDTVYQEPFRQEHVALRLDIKRFSARLGRIGKIILKDCLMGDQSYYDVHEATGCPYGAVRFLASRMIHDLRILLAPYKVGKLQEKTG